MKAYPNDVKELGCFIPKIRQSIILLELTGFNKPCYNVSAKRTMVEDFVRFSQRGFTT